MEKKISLVNFCDGLCENLFKHWNLTSKHATFEKKQHVM